jgi:hypothetical protein
MAKPVTTAPNSNPEDEFLERSDQALLLATSAGFHVASREIDSIAENFLGRARSAREKERIRQSLSSLRLTAAQLSKVAPDDCRALADEVLSVGATDPCPTAEAIAAFAGYCLQQKQPRLGLLYLSRALGTPKWQEKRGRRKDEGARVFAALQARLEQAARVDPID